MVTSEILNFMDGIKKVSPPLLNTATKFKADEIIGEVLKSLPEVKQKNYKDLEVGVSETITKYYSKNSIILTRRYYLDVLSETADRQLVLIGHLYIELFLNELINKHVGDLRKFEKANILTSFYKKVKMLEIFGVLDIMEVNTILTINSIRNAFAHKLVFTTDDIDVLKFEVVKKNALGLKIPKVRKNKVTLTRLCLKLIFWWLGLRMTEKHPEILFMDA